MYTITIRGHKDYPATAHPNDIAAETERTEALVVAEVKAMMPELVRRLKNHGINFVHFGGARVFELIADEAEIKRLASKIG